MVAMLALMALGLMFFQVGRAAVFSTEAQTGADAAALAAVDEVKSQLEQQVATTGQSNLALIDPIRVRAAAELYARRNKTYVTQLDRRGVDVKIHVKTLSKLGNGADNIDSENTRGEGRARARLDLIAIPGAGGIGGVSLGATRRGWRRSDDRRNGVEGPQEGHLEPARVRRLFGLQRSDQARRPAQGARLHGLRERRGGRLPRADPRQGRLALQVPQLGRDRRQLAQCGRGASRRRRNRQGRPGSRFSHDLASGRAL